MAKFCRFTGLEIPEGKTSLINKMCLNCMSLQDNNDGTFACCNEKVIEQGRSKILAAIPEGFEIETLTLKPMQLKNPLKKCGNYTPDIEGLIDEAKLILLSEKGD